MLILGEIKGLKDHLVSEVYYMVHLTISISCTRGIFTLVMTELIPMWKSPLAVKMC